MELRRISMFLAIIGFAAVMQCSEARHSLLRARRSSDYSEEGMYNDEGEEDAQNDDGGNEVNEPEDPVYKITSLPETYHLLVGGKVRLSCSLQPKDDYAVVSWTKGDSEKLFFGKNRVFDETRYAEDKFYIDPRSYDLIIRDATFNDTSRYTCQVEQTDKVSLTHSIIVEEPAHILSFTVSDSAPLEGSSILFTCNTRGTPPPSVIWSRKRNNKEGTEALTSAHGVFNGSTFLMQSVTTQDSGTYYCYVINTIGTDDKKNAAANLSIIVYGKPHLHVHRPVINSAIGIEAELKCFSRDGPHRITWLKDSQPLSVYIPSKYTVRKSETADGSESTLLVTPTTDQDFGSFTCEAVNSFGSHSKSVELTQSPVIEQVHSDGPKLAWTVHSHQPLEEVEINLRPLGEGGEWVKYNIPAADLLGNDTSARHTYDLSYELTDEKLAGKYEVTVKVKNDKGWSTDSNPIIIERVLESLTESESESIRTASVLGTGTGKSYATQPAFFLNAIMMYLLVRMM